MLFLFILLMPVINNLWFVSIIAILTAYLTFLTTKGGLTDLRAKGIKRFTKRGKTTIFVLFSIGIMLILQEINSDSKSSNDEARLKIEQEYRDSIISYRVDSSTQINRTKLFSDLSEAFAKQGLSFDTIKREIKNVRDSSRNTVDNDNLQATLQNTNTLLYPLKNLQLRVSLSELLSEEELKHTSLILYFMDSLSSREKLKYYDINNVNLLDSFSNPNRNKADDFALISNLNFNSDESLIRHGEGNTIIITSNFSKHATFISNRIRNISDLSGATLFIKLWTFREKEIKIQHISLGVNNAFISPDLKENIGRIPHIRLYKIYIRPRDIHGLLNF